MTIAWTAPASFADKVLDRERLKRLADGLAVALAVSLPWSTSATSILAGLWLIALVPVLDPAALRRVLATPAGSVPVLLFALAAAGMAWAVEVPMMERFHGLGAFLKLLCIPLLMAQFERSGRAPWLLAGFLGSCTVLLGLSFALALFPGIPWKETAMRGIPVKNYAAQSELFTICVFVLAGLVREHWRQHRALAAGFALLALAFLINILAIATTRTALVVLPALLLLFGFRVFGWRGLSLALAAGMAAALLAWPSSPFLQLRVGSLMTEIHVYSTANQRTSAGERLEFWRKSVGFIAQAPVFGHGTGSITDQFRRAASGETGASAVVSANPHNQVLAVAIQLGLAGTAVLLALWVAHLLLFRAGSVAAWVGLVVVVQSMVSSLFNSQLFDFTHGWAYVIGVGVCGGLMLRRDDGGGPRALLTGT